jgi:hypothetical protein
MNDYKQDQADSRARSRGAYAHPNARPGETIRFPSGTRYKITETGARVRIGPRKLSKAERKIAKRERRLDRELSASNIKACAAHTATVCQ